MALAQQLYDYGIKNADKINADDAHHPAMIELLALSDFAFKVLERKPELITWLLDEKALEMRTIEPVFSGYDLAELNESDCFNLLRDYRNRFWLKVAYLDLVKGNPIEDSIDYISRLSEHLVDSAYQWAYAQVSKVNGMPFDEDNQPMPMLILGMGKLGGKELNYSSDIDLIFTYPFNCETQGGRKTIDAHVFFTKVAQKTIAALNQVTPAGQVFRVDMRLRPFGESGPLVMSFNAMEDYYQEQGRDWERYAMLKARLLGQKSLHWQHFMSLLKPFVYRRYIDFSVIESLRKMKALISQDVRRKGLTNNIKLGAGGIREVEFVVQAFQMIRGGREALLQTQSLQVALNALVELDEINEKIAVSLKQGYLFLRRVEQYLQQFNDQQTQTLPQTERDQLRLMALLECDTYEQTLALIDQHMDLIHHEFKLVVGNESHQSEQQDARYELIWAKPKPDVLSQLEVLDASFASVIDDFKQNAKKRKIGNRGRDILDKLMPHVIEQAVKSHASQAVLGRVLAVIEKIQSRTAYLELLFENQGTLKQLFSLCAHSKWIGAQLARYPILLDELIDPAQLYQPVPLNGYQQEIRQHFLRIDEEDLELQMEALRQFKQTQQLKIAAADATGVIDIMKVSDHLTALAEAIVQQCVELAWQQMVSRFGFPAHCSDDNKGFAVIAYGKAGGYELGYDSDLDLVFVHNCDDNLPTNGKKQIDSRQFYLKLAQRLMHLFNTRTASGILYELDTRLRPEGASGLLAINIKTFEQYQHQQAWTWEHQALVRSRMIYGESSLQAAFKQIRLDVLSIARDKTQLSDDVVKMRQKMRDHLIKGKAHQFDLKQGVGGMADIEFLAQYLVLAYTEQYQALATYPDNIRIFEQAALLGVINPDEQKQLTNAYCDYRQSYHVLSLKEEAKLVAQHDKTELIAQVATIWQTYLH